MSLAKSAVSYIFDQPKNLSALEIRWNIDGRLWHFQRSFSSSIWVGC